MEMIIKINPVRLGQDIHKYLDNVEIEAKRVIEAHGLPTEQNQLTNDLIYEVINKKKVIDVLRESPDEKFSFKIPIDIYLAKNILNQCRLAQWQFEQSKFLGEQTYIAVEGFGFAIGKINQYMSMFESSFFAGKVSQHGKEKKSRSKKITTPFIESMITETLSDKSDCNPDDVINTIRNLRMNDFDIDTVHEYLKEGIPRVTISYYDCNAEKCCEYDVSQKTIANRIASLKLKKEK